VTYIKDIRKLVGHQKILSVACAAIIENDQQQILLQLRSDTKDWGVPGGNMELSETILQALIREVKEETNLQLDSKNTKLFGIYSGDKCLTIYPNLDEVQYVIFVFYTKVTDTTKLSICPESEKLVFFERNNLPTNLKDSDSIWINKWQKQDFSFELD